MPRFPILVALAAVLAAFTGAQATAAVLPSGFTESTVWSGLGNPTVVRFATDGRVFIASKSGVINVFDNTSDTSPTQFVDLRSKVHDYWDRGLLGMALDPQFTTGRPYVYVLYAYDKAPNSTMQPRWGDACPSPPGPTADGCVVTGRLSRISTTGVETVLIEDFCQQYPSHSTGSIEFGPDGQLYVSSGDGASFNWADWGQDGNPVNPCGDPGATTAATSQGGAVRAQAFRRPAGQAVTLDGSILRVNPDTGAASAGNPAISDANTSRRRIVAYGFRNPFRFTFRPGTGEIWSGDVGWNTWEEINRTQNIAQVRNYGWPCYEGTPRMGSYDSLNISSCETLYSQGAGAVTAPYYAYNHSEKVVTGETCTTGSSSISGLHFYTGSTFPASYTDGLFFSDYSRNCIWFVPKGADGLPNMSQRLTFAAQANGPVWLTQGPDGALYYADLSGGTVRRIQAANNAPTARIVANPTSGTAPLTVDFSAATSSDPENQALTYAWDLDGDGDYDDSTAASPSRTYPTTGTVTVRLRVTDTAGLTGTTTETITVGAPPTVSITAPTPTTTWAVGDTIAFAATANVPASGLTWSLALRHCSRLDATNCHTHAIQDYVGVASGSFVAPDHEYPSYLQLSVTARNGAGLTTTETRRIDPNTADLTLRSVPTGLTLSLGSDTETTPFTRTVIAKSVNSITAPTPQSLGAAGYLFASWSDALGASHAVVAPASGTTTYTATFTETAIEASLAGTDVIGANTSSATPGHAEAYRTVAGRTGVATSLRLYLDASSRASKLVLGVYADLAGEPGALLGTGTRTAPAAGAWNAVTLSTNVSIVAGTAYWISLLNPSDSTGTLSWRDRAGGSGGPERGSASNALTALPGQWATGAVYGDGPLSASAWGLAGPLPPTPASLQVTPASLSLAATQGSTDPVTGSLAVANGGDGTLSYSVADNAAWLTVSPASGNAPGTLTVSANPTGLAAGAHTATVTVTAAGVAGSPKTIPVTLSVATPSSGLVGAWGFNETTGATTADTSGNGNTGTLAGATRTTSGRFGSALTFDGVDDLVNVPDSASLDLTTGVTVEAWAYPTAGGDWRTIALKEISGHLSYALYAFGDGGVPGGHAHTAGDLWASGTSAPALNSWTHFAVTYDAITIRLFVNGVQVGTRANTGSLLPGTQPLRFGGNAIWGEHFAGRLDEIRIYDRALTAAQIQADMNRAVSKGAWHL